MRKPLIGLTTRSVRSLGGIRLDRSQAVAEPYVEAIRWAGGLPVALPSCLGAGPAMDIAECLSGIVLTGGPDVDPAHFGEEPRPGLRNVDPARDGAELALCRHAREENVPLLAICRGIQVLNVAFGGGMVQHLSEEDGWLAHEVESFTEGAGHGMTVADGTRLAGIMGAGPHRVNSHHHQGVAEPAPGLVASARSSDELVEALEHPESRFLIGVAWHPELSYLEDDAQGLLVEAFVRGVREMTGPEFLGLPEAAREEARVLVLPVPWDGTASWRRGARLGPAAILDASRYVETYDEELDLVVEDLGYHVLPAVDVDGADPDEVAERIRGAAADALDGGDRFLLTLGGEHSVSPGVVGAFAERRPGLSVLHLDAHADLRESYEGSRNSHACACRRIREVVETTVSVGVRSLSAREAELIRREDMPVFWAADVVGERDWIDDAVDLLTDDVYLTVDLDVFDPSIMPATGTPEPGGLGWYDVLSVIRRTAERRRIVGADLVELAPVEGQHAADFLAARLGVKIIAYALAEELRDT